MLSPRRSAAVSLSVCNVLDDFCHLMDVTWRVLQLPCNAADQVCLSGSEAVTCGVFQESRKRGRDGDGDTLVPSKRACLEATDVSGLGTHISNGDKEEEESTQSKQALVTDRLFSFKVSF